MDAEAGDPHILVLQRPGAGGLRVARRELVVASQSCPSHIVYRRA